MQKYVITGGPGVGKTTMLLELEKYGYVIVPEAARQIIAEEQQKPKGILPWTDLKGFQHKVLERQLDLESRVSGPVVFLDRGIVDGLAYCRLGSIVPPQKLITLAGTHRYTGVFLLDLLPNYAMDNERKEDVDTARKIHRYIHAAYEQCAYTPKTIPVCFPEERARRILHELVSDKNKA